MLAVLHSWNLTSSDYKLLHKQGQLSLPLLPSACSQEKKKKYIYILQIQSRTKQIL